MSTSAAEKEACGRAGEFRVASQLCRRKMFAALTMGKDFSYVQAVMLGGER